jgi:hypothetical protein
MAPADLLALLQQAGVLPAAGAAAKTAPAAKGVALSRLSPHLGVMAPGVLAGLNRTFLPSGLNSFFLMPATEAGALKVLVLSPTSSGAEAKSHEELAYLNSFVAFLGAVTDDMVDLRNSLRAGLPEGDPGLEVVDRLDRQITTLEGLHQAQRTRATVVEKRMYATKGETGIRQGVRMITEFQVLLKHGAYKSYTSEEYDKVQEEQHGAMVDAAAKLVSKGAAAEMLPAAASKANQGGGGGGGGKNRRGGGNKGRGSGERGTDDKSVPAPRK